LLQAEQTALIDTSHRKFESCYLQQLQDLIDLTTLDYLIVNHTEPDHSGLIPELLELAPRVTVVGSKVAIQFLEKLVHRPFRSRIVKSGHSLDLGRGHELQFISAPNLHWPDTILTYDAGTQVLYTCDVFGMHYCDDSLLDETPQRLEPDFQYYYDCLMGPNARSVLMALKRVAPLTIDLVATGHGPLLQHHIAHWVGQYETWSQNQVKTETFVALFYMDGYGASDRLVRAIADGISKTGVAIELVDLSVADTHEVRTLAQCAAGIVIGMPPQSATATTLHPLLSTILAAAHPKQVMGLFETGGGHDEPIYPLRNRLQELGMLEAFEPILIKAAPTMATDQLCREAGTDLGQYLSRNQSQQADSDLDPDLNQALGRLSTGLYILTAERREVRGAMLASWVIQASFEPLGIAIAVAKDRAIESFLQPGDTFVLNVLEEDHYQGLMKHFLKRFPPGADRFAGVSTYPARNGSPILLETLAYLECEVASRLDGGDHWLVYSTVQAGRVAKQNALTATHHRKLGHHY
jgi:flavorubredoxin/flavin reductase (DIM6/NTAB) family NADH-FMN oxidoreductase RutF